MHESSEILLGKLVNKAMLLGESTDLAIAQALLREIDEIKQEIVRRMAW